MSHNYHISWPSLSVSSSSAWAHVAGCGFFSCNFIHVCVQGTGTTGYVWIILGKFHFPSSEEVKYISQFKYTSVRYPQLTNPVAEFLPVFLYLKFFSRKVYSLLTVTDQQTKMYRFQTFITEFQFFFRLEFFVILSQQNQ